MRRAVIKMPVESYQVTHVRLYSPKIEFLVLETLIVCLNTVSFLIVSNFRFSDALH